MTHELAVKLSIDYSDALLIINFLEEKQLVFLKLLIYHSCQEAPVDAIPYGEGFPDLPFVCPNCEISINSRDQLYFDVMADATDSIEFVR